MAKLTNKKDLIEKFRKQAQRKMEKDGDQLVANFFDRYLGAMPMMERRQGSTGGHLFESWLSAIERSGAAKMGRRLAAVAMRMNPFRSGDPNASESSDGRLRRLKTKLSYHFRCALPFVSKIEKGQTIRVGDASGNQGRKTPDGIGWLYGERFAGKDGALMWVDGSGKHFAKFRTPSGPGEGVGAFAGAKDALESEAKSLGWVRS